MWNGRTDRRSLPIRIENERIVGPIEHLSSTVRPTVLGDETVRAVLRSEKRVFEGSEGFGRARCMINAPEALWCDVTRERADSGLGVGGESIGDEIALGIVIEGEGEFSHTESYADGSENISGILCSNRLTIH
jgi:hypothetical protein